MRKGAAGKSGSGLGLGLWCARGREWLRARSCRVSWLVQAVAVATAAVRVTQGFARGGRK